VQKARSPVPVSTMAAICLFQPLRDSAWISSSTVCPRKAFITSGRLIAIVAIEFSSV
jgi:hypothetical protein